MIGFYTVFRFSVNNFKNKMKENRQGYLFTLQLRIRKQIVKLNVYEDDSLNDLIKRLSKTVQYKEKYTDKLREKLQAEFKKLLRTQECSMKVKGKLESLTDESKLIIIGVSESEKNEQSLNETPFKILLDTSANARKPSVDTTKKHYNYENGSPLLRKYNKHPSQDMNFDIKEEIPLKYNYSNEKYQSKGYSGQEEKQSLREYSPIANINSKRSMKSNSNQYQNRMQLDIIAEEEERIRKEGCIRKLNAFQDKTGHYEVRDFNPKETFQDYKMQKNKSQGFISRPSAFDAIKQRGYISNQDDLVLPRPQNKLTYNHNQQALTKIDYSSKENLYRIEYSKQPPTKIDYFSKEPQTKIDYSSKYLENKAMAAAGVRPNKKFSYLSQANF